MTRRYLSPKRKAAIWHGQHERCAECGLRTVLKAMRWDHILPLCLGGDNRFANFQGLCDRCHTAKTTREAGMRAKADAQRAYHEGTKNRRGPKIRSRGFDKRLRRKMSGRVVVRS